MKIGVVVAVAGLLVAAGQLYYARESVRTQPTMGRGGDGGGGTIIGNNGTIVAGPGGGPGVGGRGGDGGSGFVRGDNAVIYGGEGGEAGKRTAGAGEAAGAACLISGYPMEPRFMITVTAVTRWAIGRHPAISRARRAPSFSSRHKLLKPRQY